MITIVDYGMGNSGSIANMLKKIGYPAIISSKIGEINSASKLILPGVGSFDTGMTNLEQSGILQVINQKVIDEKVPILGICLGMQLLLEKSEEGRLDGLGWINGRSKRFDFSTLDDSRLKVPHMGWNRVVPRGDDILLKGLESPRFYFVHSYHAEVERDEDILATTKYGYEFVSAVHKENIFGVQFHPEKSHKYGMTLLKNFMEI